MYVTIKESWIFTSSQQSHDTWQILCHNFITLLVFFLILEWHFALYPKTLLHKEVPLSYMRHWLYKPKTFLNKHVSSPPVPENGAHWELSLGVVMWRASCEQKLGGLRWKVSRLQKVAAWKEELKTVQAHSNTHNKPRLQSRALGQTIKTSYELLPHNAIRSSLCIDIFFLFTDHNTGAVKNDVFPSSYCFLKMEPHLFFSCVSR